MTLPALDRGAPQTDHQLSALLHGGTSVIWSKAKIVLLVLGHVVFGLLLAWTAHRTDADLAFFGLFTLIFTEAGLIGIGGGLSSARLAWRLSFVTVGTVYLWAVPIMAGRGKETSVFLVIALTALPILVILRVLRHNRGQLRMAHLSSKPPVSESFQSLICHLLLATTVVGLLLGFGQGVRAISNTNTDTVAVVVFPVCFILVELATLWASLGIGRPIPRLAVVVPTAFVVGAIPVYYLEDVGHAKLGRFIIWSAAVGLQSIITAASLLVVRSCGWRLVRGTSGEQRKALPTPPDP